MISSLIGLVSRVFANGLGDLGSIPGRVIPKTLKMVLDISLLNTQQYKVRIKGKVEHSWKGVVPSPTPRCSSCWKGSLLVTLDYGRQLYFTYERERKRERESNDKESMICLTNQVKVFFITVYKAKKSCFTKKKNFLRKKWSGGMGSDRLQCVAVCYLTPFWGYSIFTPRGLVDVTPWTRKAQKELYERR